MNKSSTTFTYVGNLNTVNAGRKLVNHADTYGYTALHIASSYGHVNTVTALLNGDADIELLDNGRGWNGMY